jgi:CheY-like chemotaxis protein
MNMLHGTDAAPTVDLIGDLLSRPDQTGLSVLIVDDEPDVRDELADTLARRDLSVLTAGSAADALRLLAGRPDVGALLADIRMPNQDGFELAQAALAGRDAIDALEVVLITGYASAAHGMAAERIGAYGLLPKPTRAAELHALVNGALTSAAHRRRAALHPPVRHPAGPGNPVAAAEALLLTLAARSIDAETLATLSCQLRDPLAALIAPSSLASPAQRAGARRLLSLLDELWNLADLEDGRIRARIAPFSAHAILGGLTRTLDAFDLPHRQRLTLQPEATPAFRLDLPHLCRAVELLARHALGDLSGRAIADLSLEADGGEARIELCIRPAAPGAAAAPQAGTDLSITLARRLVTAVGGRLDAWSLADGGLRARLTLGNA